MNSHPHFTHIASSTHGIALTTLYLPSGRKKSNASMSLFNEAIGELNGISTRLSPTGLPYSLVYPITKKPNLKRQYIQQSSHIHRHDGASEAEGKQPKHGSVQYSAAHFALSTSLVAADEAITADCRCYGGKLNPGTGCLSN